ncbi:MAG: MarR family winged helix-turn-helix transcriptional regulator [Hyphomicrobium sp.]
MTPSKLEDQLCFAIYSAEHAFSRAYKPMLDDLGITYPQYLVLTVLWAQDDLTVNGIGQKLLLESSTLTPLLKRLEAQGLISRSRHKADERQVRVQLTAAGKKLAQAARDIPKCMLKATGLTAEALVRLKREIEAVRDNLIASREQM